ncbi:MAG TPA: ankyrin repeat domain-containing protein [Sedimenticola thiotaurini]|uniref:Ankyrin repeat domain-containing protein n=1 Tax=Sedimenticola thiotaurini TaxID=1543721 RepID=A0A831RP79_9GAMM|nr:ankyrin repeat domain-containing protein [Sedimenticola thiotaurini]
MQPGRAGGGIKSAGQRPKQGSEGSIAERDVIPMKRLIAVLLLLAWCGPALALEPAQQLAAAAAAGRVDSVRDLLAQGVDPNAANAAGRPALVLAAFSGNLRTLQLLLGAGADANAVDAAGNSAMMEAAANGHGAVVTALLAAGGDVNLKNKAGLSALKRATLAGRTGVVEQLQAAGATEEGDGDG